MRWEGGERGRGGCMDVGCEMICGVGRLGYGVAGVGGGAGSSEATGFQLVIFNRISGHHSFINSSE